jgi:hypothetical protein
MATDRTHPPSVIDLSGLSPDAVRAVESFVADLRSSGGQPPPAVPRFVSDPRLSDEEFDRHLKELASGPPVPTLPPDFSRADLYDDHD